MVQFVSTSTIFVVVMMGMIVLISGRPNEVPSAYTDVFRNDFKEFEDFERNLPKRAYERKDGSVVMGRIPSFISKSGGGVGREVLSDEAGKPSRFARKNCFFSPVQCSFYYKRNAPLI